MRTHGAGGGSTAAKREGTTFTAVALEASSSSAIAVVGRTPRQEANQVTRARPGSDRARKDSATTLQQADNDATTTQDPDAPSPPPGSYAANQSYRPAPIWAERAPPARAAAELRRQRPRPMPLTTDVSGEPAHRSVEPSPPESTS